MPGALEPLPPDRCPSCHGPLDEMTVTQPALLRHGGYGAEERTTLRHCRCGWNVVAERAAAPST